MVEVTANSGHHQNAAQGRVLQFDLSIPLGLDVVKVRVAGAPVGVLRLSNGNPPLSHPESDFLIRLARLVLADSDRYLAIEPLQKVK
jgi:hypothetical protein